jgi:hypothetical protein
MTGNKSRASSAIREKRETVEKQLVSGRQVAGYRRVQGIVCQIWWAAVYRQARMGSYPLRQGHRRRYLQQVPHLVLSPFSPCTAICVSEAVTNTVVAHCTYSTRYLLAWARARAGQPASQRRHHTTRHDMTQRAINEKF